MQWQTEHLVCEGKGKAFGDVGSFPLFYSIKTIIPDMAVNVRLNATGKSGKTGFNFCPFRVEFNFSLHHGELFSEKNVKGLHFLSEIRYNSPILGIECPQSGLKCHESC